MEVVWHVEFQRLFSQFYTTNSHVWYLSPISGPANGSWMSFFDSAKVRFCCQVMSIFFFKVMNVWALVILKKKRETQLLSLLSYRPLLDRIVAMDGLQWKEELPFGVISSVEITMVLLFSNSMDKSANGAKLDITKMQCGIQKKLRRYRVLKKKTSITGRLVSVHDRRF